jgi:hypothetical protein
MRKSDRDQIVTSFRDARHGFGAGIPTSPGGNTGADVSAAAEGRRRGASGALFVDVTRGDLTSRGSLIALVGTALGLQGARE